MAPDHAGEPSCMLDAQTRARLRAVFDEVCAGVSPYETAARAYVASKMLKAATKGVTSADGLRAAGLDALVHCRADDVTGRAPSST
jgi:hypothetical protein